MLYFTMPFTATFDNPIENAITKKYAVKYNQAILTEEEVGKLFSDIVMLQDTMLKENATLDNINVCYRNTVLGKIISYGEGYIQFYKINNSKQYEK